MQLSAQLSTLDKIFIFTIFLLGFIMQEMLSGFIYISIYMCYKFEKKIKFGDAIKLRIYHPVFH